MPGEEQCEKIVDGARCVRRWAHDPPCKPMRPEPLPDVIVLSDVAALAALRAGGWSVAVHNDYRQNGEPRTFWLFTHPCGLWAKGEGATDEEALVAAVRQASERLGDPRFTP